MANITTVAGRAALKPRDAAHWLRLSVGCYLGYRKLAPSSIGTWVARHRDLDTRVSVKRSLGDFEALPANERYDAAKRTAEEWFAHLGKGGTTEVVTVKAACEAYVKDLLDTKGKAQSHDADMRFKRWVYGNKVFAATELSRLTRPKVEAWRKALAKTPAKVNRDSREVPITRPRSPSSLNRDMTALRAALNKARDDGHVTSDQAWLTTLRPIKAADGRRDVYLDRKQRKALIDAAQPDLAAFLHGMSLLPLRPGALAALTVASFDKRLGVLTVGKDKAGKDRKFRLPPATATLFEEASKDKLPAAPIFARADGSPWTKDAWKGPMKDAAVAAELPAGAVMYSLRHSVITDLVADGLPTLTVAQLSGTSVSMIEHHYGHLRQDGAVDALARLAL